MTTLHSDQRLRRRNFKKTYTSILKDKKSVANFSTDTTQGVVPLSIQFTSLSQDATEWYWDFGDGTNSTEKNPMHTYSSAGTYIVKLTVSNEYGTDSKSSSITASLQPANASTYPSGNSDYYQ